MKAIGGYFGLECGHTSSYHPDGIYLNSCSNGLRYLIRALGIKRIHVPVYTCHVVYDAIRKEGCKVMSYRLTKDMMPADSFPKNDYVIYNNYFGVLGNNVAELARIYPNLIVDNAQAFYSKQACLASIFSPRKFFGLPDGGILRCRDIKKLDLPLGHSTDICSHLLRRLDFDAQSGYADFRRNEETVEQYSLEQMSSLTLALMGNIDYEDAKHKRLNNFEYLHQHFNSSFPFSMTDDDVPMVYPLYLENGSDMRSKLIRNRIFVALYWPNVLNEVHVDEWEHKLATNILPLPIDQRYGREEMNRIIEIFNN